ncbi:MAG: hypothetical protein WD847_20265 [Pirellulales bacterium]
MKGYHWAAPGDVNAFFGLMLDNVANLVLLVGLLAAHFDFDATFALRYMIPPTALGVLAGDLALTWTSIEALAEQPRNLLLAQTLQTVRILSGGFIVTSLLWASGLAALVDRRLLRGAAFFGVAALASLFGVIHSPLAGNPLVIPWDMPDLPAAAHGQTPLHMAAGYALLAVLLVAWAWWAKPKPLDDVKS